ncbi:fibronectin type III domain-containing protein [Paenibacillus solanacearum]
MLLRKVWLLILCLIMIHIPTFQAKAAPAYYQYDRHYSVSGWADTASWEYENGGPSVSSGSSSYNYDPYTNTYSESGPGAGWGDWYFVENGNLHMFNTEPYCTDCESGDTITTYLGTKYPWKNEQAQLRGEFIETIIAIDGTHPNDGIDSDGYWYVKKNSYWNPLQIISPISNQKISEVTSVIPTVTAMDDGGRPLSLAYYIDSEMTPRDTKTISNTATAQTVSFSALDIGGLSEGTHTVRFTAGDGIHSVTLTVNVIVDKSPPVIGEVNFTSTDTSIRITGAASDAISGLDSAPYRYTVGSDMSPWTEDTSFEKYGLTPNTGYFAKFEARDALMHIAAREQQIYTKAQKPTVLLNHTGEAELNLSINDGNPANTRYQIVSNGLYVDESGNLTAIPSWVTLTNKNVTVGGLASNTQYSFQAKAQNEIGEETAFSQAIYATTLAKPPAQLSAEPSQRSIKVTWPVTAGASYDIEVDGMLIDNGTSAAYLHIGLGPVTQHSYRVRVRNAGGSGEWSQLITPFTLPDPPPIPGNIQVSPLQTEMTVTWDTVAQATSYDVEAGDTVYENLTQTSFVHRGLQPMTEYTYKVRSKNPGGSSNWSPLVMGRTLPYPPSTPANVDAQPSIRTVTVTWAVTEGASAYEIEADGLIIDNGAATTYIHEGLDPLTGHTYRVRATNAGGKSAWSKPVDVTTHPEKPITPNNVMATSDETEITVMWYKVPHADNYDIEIDGQTIEPVSGNSYIHTGLSPESKHTYRIRAKNISGESAWSTTASMVTLPRGSGESFSLTNMAAIVTNRFITISWDTVAPKAQYDIEVDGELRNNGKDTIFQHTGLRANEFHTYKIRLRNEDKPGEWVAILSLSTLPDPPDAPEGIEAFATNSSIEVRWTKTPGADGYEIEIDGKTISVGANTNYLDVPLAPGTAHTYRVRAGNITGVTAWSPALVKSTTSPTYIVQGKKDKTFDLSLIASNVQDFSERTFEVTYNPEQLEAVDLYNYTPKADITSGKIPGSNLEVEYASGKIIYRVKQNIVPGTSWSGEITGILFKSKIDGQALIDVVVK